MCKCDRYVPGVFEWRVTGIINILMDQRKKQENDPYLKLTKDQSFQHVKEALMVQLLKGSERGRHLTHTYKHTRTINVHTLTTATCMQPH